MREQYENLKQGYEEGAKTPENYQDQCGVAPVEICGIGWAVKNMSHGFRVR